MRMVHSPHVKYFILDEANIQIKQQYSSPPPWLTLKSKSRARVLESHTSQFNISDDATGVPL